MLSQLYEECEVELEVAGKLQKQLPGKYMMNIDQNNANSYRVGIGVTKVKMHVHYNNHDGMMIGLL